MLALFYLAGMIYFGDRLCRCCYRFTTARQRWATAFLVGLLFSSWLTYLASLAFASLPQPLVAGNLAFLVVIILAAYKMPAVPQTDYLQVVRARPTGKELWDWICLGACSVFAAWLIFATLGFQNGNFEFGFKSWSDFGANLSVSQSLVLGHNFPTEHPFFPGEMIRYHFFFWFQAANLSFLGLNLAWSVNLLSLMSFVSLLILIMTFTEMVFASRVVSRIAAALFFFPATPLSYISFLREQPNASAALNAILNAKTFLVSGYPYRGEDWGGLTVAVFANQRHLISGVGLLFVVLIFLVDRYQYQKSATTLAPALPADDETLLKTDASSAEQPAPEVMTPEITAPPSVTAEIATPPPSVAPEVVAPQHIAPKMTRSDIVGLLFSGALIGLLPYWNSAVFVASMIVLGSLFLLFPYRRQMFYVIGAAVLVGLPQILLLRAGNVAETGQTLFYFGYTLKNPENPTLTVLLGYLVWTFGFKWLLLLLALVWASRPQRRFFLAVSVLFLAVFLLKLSTDVFNNHKLLNLWNIFAAIFAAYALWRIGRGSVPRTVLACVLALLMIFGGIIDLFPVRNDFTLRVPHENDRLTTWLLANTKPSDIFLTQTLLSHPILFAGRKIYLGHTLFAWTAGYSVGPREAVYKRMFQEQNKVELLRLLHENNIAYVVIDSGVRSNTAINGLNEAVFQQNFQRVFEDTEQRYDNLVIYKVPPPSQNP